MRCESNTPSVEARPPILEKKKKKQSQTFASVKRVFAVASKTHGSTQLRISVLKMCGPSFLQAAGQSVAVSRSALGYRGKQLCAELGVQRPGLDSNRSMQWTSWCVVLFSCSVCGYTAHISVCLHQNRSSLQGGTLSPSRPCPQCPGKHSANLLKLLQ